MNCIVPFVKEVKFDSQLGDILSISLDHEYNVNKNVILGNFIVSGTYKSHELSANALEFSYTLPFDLTLTTSIIEESLKFSIDNFTYEVLDGDILKVEIDYLVKATDDLSRDETDDIFEEVITDVTESIESIFDAQIPGLEEVREESTDLEVEENKVVTEEAEVITEDRNKKSEATILNFASENEESFITYKMHIVKDGESLEGLCKLYGKSEIELSEYNQKSNYEVGDKILVALDDE